MSVELVPVVDGEIVPPLDELADGIRREHRATCTDIASSVGHARAAGEFLLEAKAQVAHGEWLPWLADNFEFTRKTAAGYMRLAAKCNEDVTFEPQSIDAGLRAIAGPAAQVRKAAQNHNPEGEEIVPSEEATLPSEEAALTKRQIDQSNAARGRLATTLHTLDGMCRGLRQADLARVDPTISENEVDEWDRIVTEAMSTLRAFRRALREGGRG